jgi:pimeloyl-ACP methyl ester carboxylesterase
MILLKKSRRRFQMKRLSCATILLSLALHLTGCGRTDLSRVAAAAQKPLVVVLGGNGSCDVTDPSPYKMPMTAKFNALKTNVEKETSEPLDYVIACYSAAEDGVYTASSLDEGTVRRVTPAQLAADLNEKFPDNFPVAVLGYSYGGWLALETALHYDNSNFSLATIDPISRRYCPTSQNGCMEFPRDYGQEDRETIREKTAHWNHYFQTKTAYLHSAPIDEADSNSKLEESHLTIQNSDVIWKRTEEEIVSSLFARH